MIFDHEAIDKSDILNIHKNLMVKNNNTKWCSGLLKKYLCVIGFWWIFSC